VRIGFDDSTVMRLSPVRLNGLSLEPVVLSADAKHLGALDAFASRFLT
jgi:hypothetical protein